MSTVYTFRGKQVEVEVHAGALGSRIEPGEPAELIILSIDGVPIVYDEEEEDDEWYIALCNHVGEQMYIDDQAAANDYARDAQLLKGE